MVDVVLYPFFEVIVLSRYWYRWFVIFLTRSNLPQYLKEATNTSNLIEFRWLQTNQTCHSSLSIWEFQLSCLFIFQRCLLFGAPFFSSFSSVSFVFNLNFKVRSWRDQHVHRNHSRAVYFFSFCYFIHGMTQHVKI